MNFLEVLKVRCGGESLDAAEYGQRESMFIEEFALMMEREGLPRMYGRVFGYLLVCDPPWQSSAQLADGLNASRGAISTATRALVEAGFIQRRKLPNHRSLYFEIHRDTLDRMMHGSVGRIRIARELSERGLALLAHRENVDRERLQAFRDLYQFMETEFPRLLARWDEKRRETP